MPGDDQRAAGIGEACRLIPVPALSPAIDQATGEAIARANGIDDLNREAGTSVVEPPA